MLKKVNLLYIGTVDVDVDLNIEMKKMPFYGKGGRPCPEGKNAEEKLFI